MKKVAIIYHSAHGHTEFIAEQILAGIATVPSVQADLLQAQALLKEPDALLEYDGFILGSSTYFGGVSAPFKAFMDATGPLWRHQRLRGRLAAGFSVSSLASGDKQSTLLSLFVFAMQHGLLWVGNPVLPEQLNGVPENEAANRLGSWSGLMAQAEKASPGHAFVPGDIKTARMFGVTFAKTLLRMQDATGHQGQEVA
ncbi:flavodoxin family protein [Pseudomonas sp. BMS12]|uniref:flavodoxin family protein n=1 Tax=Pseudomonas sp. BMS12 TaxID=1796033 RepID=UPI00083ABEE5|nr:flavodoxin family protein [Pseudomonas sp. BMS12]